MRSLPVSLTLAAVLVASFVPRAALAESAVSEASAPRQCNARIIPNGVTVPANTPALIVEDSSIGVTARVTLTPSTDPLVVALEALDDPRDPGSKLFTPKGKAALAVGASYSVHYAVACDGIGQASPTEATSVFATSAEVPLPTKIGTARELADGRAVLTLSPELAAFVHTARFEAFVDGTSVGATRYGAATGSELDVVFGFTQVTLGGAGTSGGSPSICKNNAPTETHSVKVLAHVAGAETDPAPLNLTLGVDCTTYLNTLPDGGGDDRGASGNDDLVVPNGASGCGCATVGSSPLTGIATCFGIGAGLALVLRRRRRAR